MVNSLFKMSCAKAPWTGLQFAKSLVTLLHCQATRMVSRNFSTPVCQVLGSTLIPISSGILSNLPSAWTQKHDQMIRSTTYDSRRLIGRFAQDDSRKIGDDSRTDGDDSHERDFLSLLAMPWTPSRDEIHLGRCVLCLYSVEVLCNW